MQVKELPKKMIAAAASCATSDQALKLALRKYTSKDATERIFMMPADEQIAFLAKTSGYLGRHLKLDSAYFSGTFELINKHKGDRNIQNLVVDWIMHEAVFGSLENLPAFEASLERSEARISELFRSLDGKPEHARIASDRVSGILYWKPSAANAFCDMLLKFADADANFFDLASSSLLTALTSPASNRVCPADDVQKALLDSKGTIAKTLDEFKRSEHLDNVNRALRNTVMFRASPKDISKVCEILSFFNEPGRSEFLGQVSENLAEYPRSYPESPAAAYGIFMDFEGKNGIKFVSAALDIAISAAPVAGIAASPTAVWNTHSTQYLMEVSDALKGSKAPITRLLEKFDGYPERQETLSEAISAAALTRSSEYVNAICALLDGIKDSELLDSAAAVISKTAPYNVGSPRVLTNVHTLFKYYHELAPNPEKLGLCLERLNETFDCGRNENEIINEIRKMGPSLVSAFFKLLARDLKTRFGGQHADTQ